jgi:hypothetical protein
MRYLAVILLVVLCASGSGCDGDGDTPSEDAGNGGNGSGGSSTVLLALGYTQATGTVAQFMVTEPGTLKATATWSGDAGFLEIGFYHGADFMGPLEGGSPLTMTQTVTAAHVAAGSTWKLHLYDNLSQGDTVNYKVEFTPN